MPSLVTEILHLPIRKPLHASVQLNEHRFIDTDNVSVIRYTPANSNTHTPSHLTIKLKSLEKIGLEDDEADEAWAAYQSAIRRPTR